MATLICKDRVTMSDLSQMKTPPATATHFPIPHHEALGEVIDQMSSMNFEVKGEPEIGISHEGNRCYWLMEVANDTLAKDWGTIIGGRNSHDKSFSFRILGGFSVFICENTQATGEVSVTLKHTKNIVGNLKPRVTKALEAITHQNLVQTERIEAYKSASLPYEDHENIKIKDDSGNVKELKRKYDSSAYIHDFVVRSMYQGVISPSSVKTVLDEWRQPKYEDFTGRNVWSLSNAYTEAFKKYSNPEQLFSRGIMLTKMMDDLSGYEAPPMPQSDEEMEVA
tara:strand:- start:1975 stop:2817 length:843 start_codon:yes stop_codon:yes gene_type:complete